MIQVCIAFKAHLGWVNAVAVRDDTDTPTPEYAGRVELLSTGDRAIREPYHVAGGWSGLTRVARPDDPADVVRRGRAGQATSAAEHLKAFRETLLAQDLRWTRSVVLTARGRLGDDLEHILGSHAHIHVAEGEAIRDATRAGLDQLAIPYVDQDEKVVPQQAAAALHYADADECDALMKRVRPPGARSWTKEHRLIGLAAWLNR